MYTEKIKRFRTCGKVADIALIVILVAGVLLTVAGLIQPVVTDIDFGRAANFILSNDIPVEEFMPPDDILISVKIIFGGKTNENA